MAKGLQLADPPRRRADRVSETDPASRPAVTEKFAQVAENEKVQFNKRITRGTADGYEMLAIRTRKKVPELLTEALDLLQEKYGKI